MAEEAIPSDSGPETGTTATESADDSGFDLGLDLDEDLSPPERSAPAAPSPSPRTPEPEAPAQSLDLDTVEVDKLPPELQKMARELKGDYTRKRQGDAEQARQVQALKEQLETRERVHADSLVAGKQGEDDPFAALRSTLTEDEARGLDIVDQIVAAKHGKTVEDLGSRLDQQQTLIQKLALAVVQQAAGSANSAAAAARQQYPDIDQYKDQVNALVAVPNPATGQNYTVTEAYELITGKAQARSNDLAAADLNTRTASARATTATSTAAADPGLGELNPTQLTQGLKDLGFD